MRSKNNRKQGIISPYILATASALIWGSGQMLGRQYKKAALLFLGQFIFFFIELSTGNYFSADFTPRNGGFFLRGLWGLVTLGTEPRKMTLAGLSSGDHSVILMINGIIALFILTIAIIIYIWNILDAFKTQKKYLHLPFHFIILIPAIFLIGFFVALPIIFSFLIAFTNYSVSNLPPTQLLDWVGFKNFINIFRISVWSFTFIRILGWTLIWTVLATLSCYFGGLFQAVIINNKRVKLKRIWRGIFILPWAIPGMISLLVFKTMFNGQFGPISQFLLDIGFTDERIAWLSDPQNPNLARMVILLINLWLGFPYFMALMTGVLTSISTDVIEASRVDGATSFQEFWRIKFPIVLQATMPLLIMTFAGYFNNFGVIFFLTDGGPVNANYQFAGSTDILITWIYRLTLDHQFYNMAAVMSTMIFLIIGSLSIWNFRRTQAFKEYGD